MNQQLEPETMFSRRLRAELKALVAERGAAQAARATLKRRTAVPIWIRRGPSLGLGLGVAVAAVLFVAALILVIGAGDATPEAFAVEVRPEGIVSVEISSLEDAPSLEGALEEDGIPASITYLGSGMVCKEPRFQPAEWPEGGGILITGAATGNGSIHFDVASGTVGPGQTLVFTASPGLDPGVDHIEAKLANGPVAPCEPMPAPSR